MGLLLMSACRFAVSTPQVAGKAYDTTANVANRAYDTTATTANRVYETGARAGDVTYETGREGARMGASAADRAALSAEQALADAKRGYEMVSLIPQVGELLGTCFVKFTNRV